MDIVLEGKRIHKNFLLNETCSLSGGVIVLTGRNGSGKTRLLESIASGSTSIIIDGVCESLIHKKLFKFSDLVSNLSDDEFSRNSISSQIDNLLRAYDSLKANVPELLSSQNLDLAENSRKIEPEWQSCYQLCLLISQKTGKKLDSLTHNDIILHFPLIGESSFNLESISTLFNNYLKKRQQNDLNKYFNEVLGKSDFYYEEEDFLNCFGDYPWLKVNEILHESFDGKFNFTFPDVDSRVSYFNSRMKLCSNNEVISFKDISSGENTLLWLALTLVRCQYHDSTAGSEKRLLLIDEPDAFLHPKMVTVMYKVFEAIGKAFNTTVVFTTHSPTTVALAPSNIIYLVEENSIRGIEKDEAVAELLVGVTQISINPKNRRQVFVESMYDVDVYQAIFLRLVKNPQRVDPKITLNFVSSGPKVHEEQVRQMATKYLSNLEPEQLSQFIKAVNGVGNCDKVQAQVQSLAANEHDTVRGIIDWDLGNKPSGKVAVLAEGFSYSIENITLDPICIIILLHIYLKDRSFPMEKVCGSEVNIFDWLNNVDLLQKSLDWFVSEVLGRENKRDMDLIYVSKVILHTDSEYLTMNGHELERKIIQTFQGLLSLVKKGSNGQLKSLVVSEAMIKITDGRFIPKAFEDVLVDVQK